MSQGQSQVKLLTINQFAQVCRTTPKTLRLYQKKGLFKPAKIDSYNGYRFYNPYQSREFLRIKLLQNFHFPLSKIAKSIKKNQINQSLEQELKKIREEIKEKQKEYRFLKNINLFILESDNLKPLLKKEVFGPYTLFCVYLHDAEYTKITDYIKSLWKVANGLKLRCVKSEITFYLDSVYRPKNTELEIVLICKNNKIPKLVNLPNNYYFKKYPKTPATVYQYEGPYDYLPLVYKKLYDWMDSQNMNRKKQVFEKYIYGPLNTKSKYDYLTKIAIPI